MVGVIFTIVFTFYYFLLVDFCWLIFVLFLLCFFSFCFIFLLVLLSPFKFFLILCCICSFISYLCYCIYYQFISFSRVISWARNMGKRPPVSFFISSREIWKHVILTFYVLLILLIFNFLAVFCIGLYIGNFQTTIL